LQDKDLYSQILGIREPWSVDRVDLDLKKGEVNVHLTHDAGAQWPCPECGTLCPLYDHQPLRRWRHLDTCQLRTILNADPPRSNCPEHSARTVKLPWAETGSRFTALFEALAIDWLRAASQQAVADRLQLSWDEVHAMHALNGEAGAAIRRER
jgi:transposase